MNYDNIDAVADASNANGLVATAPQGQASDQDALNTGYAPASLRNFASFVSEHPAAKTAGKLFPKFLKAMNVPLYLEEGQAIWAATPENNPVKNFVNTFNEAAVIGIPSTLAKTATVFGSAVMKDEAVMEQMDAVLRQKGVNIPLPRGGTGSGKINKYVGEGVAKLGIIMSANLDDTMQWLQENRGYNPEQLSSKVGNAGASMLASMGLIALTMASGGTALAGAGVASGAIAATSGAESFLSFKNKQGEDIKFDLDTEIDEQVAKVSAGLDESDRKIYGMLSGTAQGGSELLGNLLILGAGKPLFKAGAAYVRGMLGTLVKGAFSGSFGESAEELVAGEAQFGIDVLMGQRKADEFVQAQSEIFTSAGIAAVLGGAPGATYALHARAQIVNNLDKAYKDVGVTIPRSEIAVTVDDMLQRHIEITMGVAADIVGDSPVIKQSKAVQKARKISNSRIADIPEIEQNFDPAAALDRAWERTGRKVADAEKSIITQAYDSFRKVQEEKRADLWEQEKTLIDEVAGAKGLEESIITANEQLAAIEEVLKDPKVLEARKNDLLQQKIEVTEKLAAQEKTLAEKQDRIVAIREEQRVIAEESAAVMQAFEAGEIDISTPEQASEALRKLANTNVAYKAQTLEGFNERWAAHTIEQLQRGYEVGMKQGKKQAQIERQYRTAIRKALHEAVRLTHLPMAQQNELYGQIADTSRSIAEFQKSVSRIQYHLDKAVEAYATRILSKEITKQIATMKEAFAKTKQLKVDEQAKALMGELLEIYKNRKDDMYLDAEIAKGVTDNPSYEDSTRALFASYLKEGDELLREGKEALSSRLNTIITYGVEKEKSRLEKMRAAREAVAEDVRKELAARDPKRKSPISTFELFNGGNMDTMLGVLADGLPDASAIDTLRPNSYFRIKEALERRFKTEFEDAMKAVHTKGGLQSEAKGKAEDFEPNISVEMSIQVSIANPSTGVLELQRIPVQRRINRAQLRSIVWMAQNERVAKQLEESNGLGAAELFAMESMLTTEEWDSITKRRATYDKIFEQVSAVYREYTGQDIPKEDFYFPTARDYEIYKTLNKGLDKNLRDFLVYPPQAAGAATDVDTQVDKPTNRLAGIVPADTKTSPRDVEKSQFLSRTKSMVPYVFEPDYMVDAGYAADMAHFISFAPYVNKMHTVLNNTAVRTLIEAQHGKQLLSFLDTYYKLFVNDTFTVNPSVLRHWVVQGLSQAGIVMVGTPKQALLQLSSVSLALKEVPLKAYLKHASEYVAKAINGDLEADDLFMDLAGSDFVKNRAAGAVTKEHKIRRMQLEAQMKGGKIDAGALSAVDLLSLHMRIGDKYAVVMGAYIIAKEKIKQIQAANPTMPAKDVNVQAQEYALKWANTAMQSTDSSYVTPFAATQDVFGYVSSMFTSMTVASYNQFLQTNLDLRNGRITFPQYLKRQSVVMLLSTFLAVLARNLRLPDDAQTWLMDILLANFQPNTYVSEFFRASLGMRGGRDPLQGIVANSIDAAETAVLFGVGLASGQIDFEQEDAAAGFLAMLGDELSRVAPAIAMRDVKAGAVTKAASIGFNTIANTLLTINKEDIPAQEKLRAIFMSMTGSSNRAVYGK